MCVICVKKQGKRLPTYEELELMWARNPHGAGFMFARNGLVHIRKGFMTLSALIHAMNEEKITKEDSLVIHFRISTQGGITQENCHPFPISPKLEDMEALEITSNIGIAHNGIIQRTSQNNCKYSDTALFVIKYLCFIYRSPKDIYCKALNEAAYALAPYNKFALMNGDGKITLLGDFQEKNGLLYSNLYHVPNYRYPCKKFSFYDDDLQEDL